MKHLWIACLTAGAIACGIGVARADRGDPAWIDTQEFATLPSGVRYPEGITANPATGDLYVGTFDAREPASTRNNKLLRYSRSGRLLAQKDFGPAPLLGLGFREGKVYILNFGASELQRIAANFDAATPVETVAVFGSLGPPPPRPVPNPDGSADVITFGSSGFPAPNAMVFDAADNLYVSDSFQGAIYRIVKATSCAAPCPVTLLAHDPLLATAGFPPFGANGLALNADETALFIANTGDNRVLKMALPAAAITVLAESLHGADGLLFYRGRLWVAANQADSVYALNDNGRIAVRAGEFEGVGRDGAPRGLLFPASLVALDGWIYVTNLALPLTPMTGDEPEEDVTRWNIARFRVPR
jgi:DNA-binding beta-propeller fold protein YncE